MQVTVVCARNMVLPSSTTQEPLLPPMTPGNYQHRNSTCLLQLEFEQAVVQHHGFNWRNERPEGRRASDKWGWIGQDAGSWAELQIDTSASMEVRTPPCLFFLQPCFAK